MSAMDTQMEPLLRELEDRDLSEVAVSCACGGDTASWRCSTLEGISRWPGEVFALNDILMAMCPDCANIREVDLSVTGLTNETYELAFALEDIRLAADEAAEGSMRQFNRRLEEAVGLDPDRLTSCTECGGPMYREDKQAGPEAPEIGWEYYECPHCTERFSPRVVEGSR